jgi:hypothetical protein
MWRYPLRTSDETHLPVHFNFDVREFAKRLDLLLRMLGGAAIGLDMAREEMSDAMAYEQSQYEGDEVHEEPHYEEYDYEPPEYE